ncbi:MAG: hypothetical protein IPI35_28060 [Deltaproteobacteria bacterium]|nr:hypothetical protein [Deltaproteobacteria bacterium]
MPALRPAHARGRPLLPLLCGKRSTVSGTAAMALMGLTLMTSACRVDALYGAPASVDEDGDGYGDRDGDCDDSDAAINPGAIDTVDDGVDSNCDGDDNT